MTDYFAHSENSAGIKHDLVARDFFAHSANDHNRWHLLRTHLTSVGKIAREIAGKAVWKASIAAPPMTASVNATWKPKRRAQASKMFLAGSTTSEPMPSPGSTRIFKSASSQRHEAQFTARRATGATGRSRNQRGDQVTNGLSLDQHLTVDQVITGSQTVHPHVEPAAPTHGVQQCRVAFGVVDNELMDGVRRARRRRDP